MKTSILFKWPKYVSHACPHYIRWLRNIVLTFMNSIIMTEFSNFIYESLFTISTFIAACQLPQASNVCLPVCPFVCRVCMRACVYEDRLINSLNSPFKNLFLTQAHKTSYSVSTFLLL